MDISTGNVISALAPLLAIAAAWGSIKARIERTETDVKALTEKVEERLKEFQKSREDQGERIGATEKAMVGVERDLANIGQRVGLISVADSSGGARRRRLTKPGGET